MKLRGYGDLLGFKQSGIKNFRLADPIHNEDLFILGENEIKRIEKEEKNLDKYKILLKLYDQADIINDIIQPLGLDVPADTINFEASSKLISRYITSFFGNISRNPLVGLGVVGTKTLINS